MKRLYINPITRTIEPKHRSLKAVYVSKGDRDSTLLRFEIPQTVDGFDMSESTIQIHYANISRDELNISKGMSDAIDVEANDDTVTFAWKIPKTATRYAGVLSIGVTFEKYDNIDAKAEEIYSWSTAPYGEIVVCDSYDNSAETTEREYDYLVETCNALVQASLKGNLKPLFDEVATDATTEAEGYMEEASAYAMQSQSYAEGGTNAREGEETDNAKYYCGEAKKYSQSASTSATNAQTAESKAKGYMEKAEGYKNAASGIKTEVITLKSDVLNAKSVVETAKDNAEASRNATSEYAMYVQASRNETEGFKNEAEGFRNEAENFMASASGHSGRASDYAQECKTAYDNLLKAFQNEVIGNGAIRLEDVNAGIKTAKVECESPVTMYGKNLTNFTGNWKTLDNGRPYFIINVPCTVMLSVTRTGNGGTVAVYKSKTDTFSEGERVSLLESNVSSGKVFTPLLIEPEEGYYYCVSTVSSSKGYFTQIQTEAGSVATEYEAYKEPVTLTNLNEVELYSPTATLITSPDAPITATYTKDINRTIERLENAIANS